MADQPLGQWDTSEHLLAAIFDTLRGANYQRSGGKGKKPKPLPRPGDEPENRPLLKGQAMSPAELDAELERRYKPAEPDHVTPDPVEEVDD